MNASMRKWTSIGLAGALALVPVILWAGPMQASPSSATDSVQTPGPETELDGLLDRAEAAIFQGNLVGNDGTSASELLNAALDLAPGNERALMDLKRGARAATRRADVALGDGKLDEVEYYLAAAQELGMGRLDPDYRVIAEGLAKARVAAGQPRQATNGTGASAPVSGATAELAAQPQSQAAPAYTQAKSNTPIQPAEIALALVALGIVVPSIVTVTRRKRRS